MSNDWSNESPINIRTKLAIRVLLLIFAIIAPYQFEHKFEKELESLKKLLDDAEAKK